MKDYKNLIIRVQYFIESLSNPKLRSHDLLVDLFRELVKGNTDTNMLCSILNKIMANELKYRVIDDAEAILVYDLVIKLYGVFNDLEVKWDKSMTQILSELEKLSDEALKNAPSTQAS